MHDGETREVASMSGGSTALCDRVLVEIRLLISSTDKYQIKKCAGDIYYCLCPAWKNQNHPVDRYGLPRFFNCFNIFNLLSL